jgi:hypothetical protein
LKISPSKSLLVKNHDFCDFYQKWFLKVVILKSSTTEMESKHESIYSFEKPKVEIFGIFTKLPTTENQLAKNCRRQFMGFCQNQHQTIK